MSVEGLIVHHGEADGVTLHNTRVDYLLTAERSKQCSVFEFSVAPSGPRFSRISAGLIVRART
jgi:hypothetical protein